MGASGSFPIDIVLFGMVAAFLVLRLRSILGKRTGFERPAEPANPQAAGQAVGGRVIDAVAEPATSQVLPEPSSPAGLVLTRMVQADPSFHPGQFLGGAETAFRMIVGAFAAGDRVTLRNLLADETYKSFEGAIAAREAAGETQRTEIRAITTMAMEQAELRDRLALITVRFVSDQVNMTSAADGAPVAGTDGITEITDLWTFERELGSADPTWRLVAARSA
jgi:predicted lipid-binding transport protein (Tim44 family)